MGPPSIPFLPCAGMIHRRLPVLRLDLKALIAFFFSYSASFFLPPVHFNLDGSRLLCVCVIYLFPFLSPIGAESFPASPSPFSTCAPYMAAGLILPLSRLVEFWLCRRLPSLLLTCIDPQPIIECPTGPMFCRFFSVNARPPRAESPPFPPSPSKEGEDPLPSTLKLLFSFGQLSCSVPPVSLISRFIAPPRDCLS